MGNDHGTEKTDCVDHSDCNRLHRRYDHHDESHCLMELAKAYGEGGHQRQGIRALMETRKRCPGESLFGNDEAAFCHAALCCHSLAGTFSGGPLPIAMNQGVGKFLAEPDLAQAAHLCGEEKAAILDQAAKRAKRTANVLC
ncbi:hypothetical protein CONLIGDRAFT_692372 [Coniochaeta ligniaria NRRL 30616]|uniref:Uncharacterized protein n=1 Tax=Coniochaeta ligniaria NRRL 30616 TaxID=1408157 RepID=A0A1J7I9L5_9PEZI|nr:hypothetical protein CONLIGDRAFT_692372 [Coniochaeta ligniaria NRRL 30616]